MLLVISTDEVTSALNYVYGSGLFVLKDQLPLLFQMINEWNNRLIEEVLGSADKEGYSYQLMVSFYSLKVS